MYSQPKTKRRDDSRERLEWCVIFVLLAILCCCGCQTLKPLGQTADPFSRYHNGSLTVIPELATGAAVPAMTPGTNQPRFVPELTNGPFRSAPITVPVNTVPVTTDTASTGGVTLGSGYGTENTVNTMNTSPSPTTAVDVEMAFDTVQNATAGQSAVPLHGSTATSGTWGADASGGTSATTSTYIGTP